MKTTPVDVSDVGAAERMPVEAAVWRFNIRRDIIVTLTL